MEYWLTSLQFDIDPDSLGDKHFTAGQASDAAGLNDPIDPATGKPIWDKLFLNPINRISLLPDG